MFSKNPTNHCRGFGNGFTELHAKIDADMLLDFAIHHRQNKTRSQKSTLAKTICVQGAVSHARLMQ
jgi:hypothetical protein